MFLWLSVTKTHTDCSKYTWEWESGHNAARTPTWAILSRVSSLTLRIPSASPRVFLDVQALPSAIDEIWGVSNYAIGARPIKLPSCRRSPSPLSRSNWVRRESSHPFPSLATARRISRAASPGALTSDWSATFSMRNFKAATGNVEEERSPEWRENKIAK